MNYTSITTGAAACSIVLACGLKLGAGNSENASVSEGRTIPSKHMGWLMDKEDLLNWSKLRTNMGPWMGKKVTLEGMLRLEFSPYREISEAYLCETRDAFEYDLQERSVYLDLEGLKVAMSSNAEIRESLLMMLAGKWVRVSGSLDECPDPHELGTLLGPLEVARIELRGQELEGNLGK